MPARLTFTLEALEADASVPFDAFAEMVAHAAALLLELDTARSGAPSVRWVVRDLAAGSAVVGIEAIPINPLFDVSESVVRDFASGMSVVATEGRRPPNFTDVAWQNTQAIVEILHDGIGRLAIDGGPESVVLTKDVRLPDDDHLLVDLAPVEVDERQAISTIEGSLETVNGHDPNQMYFAVWDVLYHRRIRCDFDANLLDHVRRGLLERVRVHGLIRFDRLGHPVRVVEVRAIQVLERGVSRPRPADLRGLAPEITGGLDSVEWVRRIRDA